MADNSDLLNAAATIAASMISKGPPIGPDQAAVIFFSCYDALLKVELDRAEGQKTAKAAKPWDKPA